MISKKWEGKGILQNICLAGLSGILTFLAFPPFGLAPLAWISTVPLLLAIWKSKTSYNAFFYSFLSGLVFFASALYWLTNVTIPGTIALVFILAFSYGIFGFCVSLILKYGMDLLITPFIWVLTEYIRSNILTGFPWALLSYSQYQNILLIQIADLTGSYGVSFLVIAFNAACFALIIRSKDKMTYLVVALLFIIMAVSYGKYRLDNYHVWGSPRISIVQGNIPQEFKWDADFADEIITKYNALTLEAAKDKPDIIIWPETAYPYLAEGEVPPEEISALAKDIKIPILAGAIYKYKEDYYNSALLYNEKGELSEIYKKIHLVPFGEYVPLEKFFFLLRRYINKPIGDFKGGHEYTLFPLKSFSSSEAQDGSTVRSISFYKIGVLICFEDVFPYLARGFVKNGANLLVNITNDAWFGPTAAAKQHLQASIFRAVENRTPVIRSANTGVSCFIDSFGRILSTVEEGGKSIFVSGYKTANIPICRTQSFYTKYGDMFVYFCIVMVLILLITETVFRKK